MDIDLTMFKINKVTIFVLELLKQSRPELFILCKNVWGPEGAAVAKFDIPTDFEQLSC